MVLSKVRVTLLAVVAIMLAILGICLSPNRAEALVYSGVWDPPPIQNGGVDNIWIDVTLDVEISYNPGDTEMSVSFKKRSIEVIGNNGANAGRFWDGFCLVKPPAPSTIYPGAVTVPGSVAGNPDSLDKAVSDFDAYAATGGEMIWWVLQLNNSSTNWAQGDTLSDGQWHTYTYDLSGYRAGDDPVLMYYGNRSWQSLGSCVATRDVLYASTLGINLKVAPKVTSSADTGGTISPRGEIYYEYGNSATYRITPQRYYGVSDVLVDGVSVGSATSYTFNSVEADHTIRAKFAPLSGKLKVQKRDGDSHLTSAQGNASLAGTKFEVVCLSSPFYTAGDVVATLTTNANGYAECNLNGGKFEVHEISASSSYLQTDEESYQFEIVADSQTVDLTHEDTSFYNSVAKGGISFVKHDGTSVTSEVQGDGDMTGATFVVYNVSDTSVWIDGVEYPTYKDTKQTGIDFGKYKSGEYNINCLSNSFKPCYTLKTNENGYATTGLNLPVGKYVICEKIPPTGYLINLLLQNGISFEITENGEMVSFS